MLPLPLFLVSELQFRVSWLENNMISSVKLLASFGKLGRWCSFPPILQIFRPEYHWLRLVPIRQRPWNHPSPSGTGTKPRHQTGTWSHKNYSHPCTPSRKQNPAPLIQKNQARTSAHLKAISCSNAATLKKFLTVHKTWRYIKKYPLLSGRRRGGGLMKEIPILVKIY